jgi:hypothetical protein
MQTLSHGIDRLWYHACLETIRQADVYNPGARHRVPMLYLIDSYKPVEIGSLPVGESIRLLDAPQEKYEIVAKQPSAVIVRSVEGYISELGTVQRVVRQNNLTRSPDGNQESKVVSGQF